MAPPHHQQKEEREKDGERKGGETAEIDGGGGVGADREETSWKGDKEARRRGVKLMQIITLNVLQQHNDGEK